MSLAAPARVAAVAMLAVAACAEPEPIEHSVSTHVEDWRDEILYQVLVDRFENGDTSNDALDGYGLAPGDLERHQGGDWAGLRERLDYIQALGATTIWISPIVANVDRGDREDGYHGYWASDFTTLNPRYGDLETLRALIRDAHARGMKVIADVVLNHAGRVFDYDLNGNGVSDEGEAEPPYLSQPYEAPLLWTHRPSLFSTDGGTFRLEVEHFRRRGLIDFGDSESRRFGDFPTGLRDLDTSRDDVVEGLVATYAHWVLETDLDGFRVDVVPHMEDAFWPRFGRGLRAALSREGKRRFLLVGEVFDGNPVELARYSQEDGALDSAFDFTLKFDVMEGMILDGAAPAVVAPALGDVRDLYRTVPQPGGVELSPWQARVGFIDNHDTFRIRGDLNDDAAVRLSIVLLGTVDAIPCLFYGTEQDMVGRGGASSRAPLWTVGFDQSRPTYRFIREVFELRQERRALQRGDLTIRYASEYDGFSDEPDAGLLAFERFDGEQRILVVINAHATKSSSAAVPSGYAAGTDLRALLSSSSETQTFAVGATGGNVQVQLEPRGFVVLAR